MTDPQILPRLLAAELDRLEGDMARHLRGVTPCIDFSAEGYMKSYGQLLELQAMVSSRRVEVADARGPQSAQSERRLRYQETLDVLNALIEYHKAHSPPCNRPCWTVDDHRSATETLKLLRDHLDHCYEVRS